MTDTNSSIVEAVAFYNKKIEEKQNKLKQEELDIQAEKEKGIAAGAFKHANIIDASKAVARKLGTYGVVTIDDVTHEMRRMGYKNVEVGSKDAPKTWKGSVFSDADWVCVGTIASREKRAHGRHVGQWALKSWLREHPINGTNSNASAFSLYKIFKETIATHPGETEFVLLLGRDALDSSFMRVILKSQTSKEDVYLFGCKVIPCNGVGAICIPKSMLNFRLGVE